MKGWFKPVTKEEEAVSEHFVFCVCDIFSFLFRFKCFIYFMHALWGHVGRDHIWNYFICNLSRPI